MSDERLRRRRPTGSTSRRSSNGNGFAPWLITIVAALAVIAGGWFLGQALAHAFGGRSESQTAQLPTSVPLVTPLPSVTAAPSPASSDSGATAQPSPTTTPSPERRALALATPSASPTHEPTPEPSPTSQPTQTPAATPSPSPPPEPTKRPRTPEPAAPPSREAASSQSAAEQTVRAYIGALMRGDPQAAAAYLGNGAPDEGFINSQTRIESMDETVNADGSSNVNVLMDTTEGRYKETFEVAAAAGGNRILDKSATKP